jgi:hypothetical protein
MVKHPSFGAALYIDIAGGSDYSKVGQLGDLSGPSISRGEVDVTDHDNAVSRGGDGYREFLGGVPDGGEITGPIHWDPNNDDTHGQTAGSGILATLTKDTLVAWKIEVNQTTGTLEWTTMGFLSGFSPEYPVEGANTGEITIKVSGKPTINLT